MTPGRWGKSVLTVVLALLGLWIGSMVLLGGLLLGHVSHFRRMAADPAKVKLSSLATEVHQIHGQFSLLQAELTPVLWMTSQFPGDVGAVRPMAQAGAEMLTAADQ